MQTMALAQASQQLDNFIDATEQLGLAIQKDTQLLPYNISKWQELPHNIVWELEPFSPSINSLTSLGIVYTASSYPQINNKIYASSGIYSIARYAQTECNGYINEDILTDLLTNSETHGFIKELTSNNSCLLYVMPIPGQYVFSSGKLLLRLDYQDFTKSLAETAGEDSDVYVFDNNDDLILYVGNTYVNTQAARIALAEKNLFSGKAVFKHTIENYGIVVKQTVDRNKFYSTTISALLGLFIVVCVIIVFGIYLSFAFAQIAAKPLKQLVKEVSSLGAGSVNANSDEIEALSTTFEYLVTQQNSLSHAMENQSQLEEAQYVLNILGIGDNMDFSDFILEKYRPWITAQSLAYCVMIFRFDNTRSFLRTYTAKEQWQIKSEFRSEFQSLSDALGFGAAADLPDGQGIAAFIAFNPARDIMKDIEQIHSQLRQSCNMSLSCSVSPIISQSSELAAAYKIALKNSRYRLFNLNTLITPLFVSEIKEQRGQTNSLSADEIVQAVRVCNHEKITQSIDNYFIKMMHGADLSFYKLSCFDLLTLLGKLIKECDTKQHEMLLYQLDILYESCYESIENLKQYCTEFCFLLSNALYQKRVSQLTQSGLQDVVYKYVETHFSSSDLSLSTIAEALSFSPSYLTRSFKEKTGISLMQYIDKKRFAECKNLLLTTNLPIKEIVERVGYTDEANFSRKFRKHEGVTPSQYRTMRIK